MLEIARLTADFRLHDAVGPNNTVEHPPEFCQPTRDCQTTRLQALSNTCLEPQGFFEPIPCPPGFYCPEGGKQQLPCPTGHYCPLGSFEPWSCDAISVCSSNSSRHFSLTGIVALGLLDLLIVVITAQPRMKRFWHTWRRSKILACVDDQEPPIESAPKNVNQETEEFQVTSDGTFLPLHQFVKSIQRCIQLKDIGLEIGFDQLGFQLQSSGKNILKGVSGIVKPRSLLGVMGPSGAGKCKWEFHSNLFFNCSIVSSSIDLTNPNSHIRPCHDGKAQAHIRNGLH